MYPAACVTHLSTPLAAEYLALFVSAGERQRHGKGRPLTASEQSHRLVRLLDPRVLGSLRHRDAPEQRVDQLFERVWRVGRQHRREVSDRAVEQLLNQRVRRLTALCRRQTNKQINKPVDELARALLSFKRPLLSVDVMVGMYDGVERYRVLPC